MRKITFFIINVIFMTSNLVNAFDEKDVLYENITQKNAGSLGIFTEKTFPYTYRVVHNPQKIAPYKEKITSTGTVFAHYPNFKPNTSDIGMGQFKFAQDGDAILETSGLRDCIALVAFDETTKKSVLYHVSKMELRPNDFGDLMFEKYFMVEFLKFFGATKPKITLIGSAYSRDLYKLLDLLNQYDLRVSEYNFPDIAVEESQTVDPQTHLILDGSMTIFLDKTSVQLENNAKGLPDTSVLLNSHDGSIKVSRDTKPGLT